MWISEAIQRARPTRRRASLLALALAACLLLSATSALAGTVTVKGAGAGTGVVTVTGAKKGTLIDCTLTAGVASGTCSASFAFLEAATVEVTPDTRSGFARWSSVSGGTSNTCAEAANPCTFSNSFGAVALTAELEHSAVYGVVTNGASQVTIEGATLNGALTPEGAEAEYLFEYGTSSAYGLSTPAQQTNSIGRVSASSALVGLMPFTTYHYRLVARRTIEGVPRETDGLDETFTTLGVAPQILSQSASAVTAFSATLEASVNPDNAATSYYFVYGESPGSEQAFLPAATVGGYGSVPVQPRVLQALKPATTYHFHLVAENAFGRVEDVEGPSGPEEGSFTTEAASPPDVSLAPVVEVGSSSAGLLASVNPHGLASEYEVELGQSGSFAAVVVRSAGSGEGASQVSYALSSLAPGNEYEVRVRAWNAAGEALSAVQSFTTAAGSAPALVLSATPPLLSAVPVRVEAKGRPKQTRTKKLTKAQKLKRALKLCTKKPKRKRAACRRAAHRRYRPSKHSKRRRLS